jgi:ribosomal protein L16 Arg81 hydroxylase
MNYNTGINWDLFKNQVDLIHNDKPIFIKNLLPNPERYVTKKEIEKALNQYQVQWNIIGKDGSEIEIPEYWNAWHGYPIQDKSFIHNKIKEGCTFIINKYRIHNNFTQTLCLEIEKNFHGIQNDLHVYGGFGDKMSSFDPHFDNHSVMIFQVIGECPWIVYNNQQSTLISSNPAINPSKLTPYIEVNMTPGDFLYIPERWIHFASPKEERISITVSCPQNKGNGWDKNYYKL